MFDIEIFESNLNDMATCGKDATVIETPEKLSDDDIFEIRVIARKHGYDIFYYKDKCLLIYSKRLESVNEYINTHKHGSASTIEAVNAVFGIDPDKPDSINSIKAMYTLLLD